MNWFTGRTGTLSAVLQSPFTFLSVTHSTFQLHLIAHVVFKATRQSIIDRGPRAQVWDALASLANGPQRAEPMTGTVRLTRAQAHRLIETYGYSGPPEPLLTG